MSIGMTRPSVTAAPVDVPHPMHRAMAAAFSAILEEQSGLELLTPDGEPYPPPLHAVPGCLHYFNSTLHADGCAKPKAGTDGTVLKMTTVRSFQLMIAWCLGSVSVHFEVKLDLSLKNRRGAG